MQKKRSTATNVVVLISYDSTALMCIVYISFNLNNISGHFHKQRDCLFVGVCVRHERDSKLKAFPCDRALCVRKNRCRVPVHTTSWPFHLALDKVFVLLLTKFSSWSWQTQSLVAAHRRQTQPQQFHFSVTMVLEEDDRTGRGIPHISSTFNNKLVARSIMMVLLIMIVIVLVIMLTT